MTEAIRQILINFLSVIYQITSLEIWGINLGQTAQNTHDYIINSPVISMLQLILIPITIFLFFILIRVLRKEQQLMTEMRDREEAAAAATASTEPEKQLTARWQEILNFIDSIREGEWKFALIEADKLVDDVLKNSFPGETMGERLMNIDKTQLLSIDSLWEAHKIRNRLAHDTNYFLRHAEAVRAIRLYEQALKELGAL